VGLRGKLYHRFNKRGGIKGLNPLQRYQLHLGTEDGRKGRVGHGATEGKVALLVKKGNEVRDEGRKWGVD